MPVSDLYKTKNGLTLSLGHVAWHSEALAAFDLSLALTGSYWWAGHHTMKPCWKAWRRKGEGVCCQDQIY